MCIWCTSNRLSKKCYITWKANSWQACSPGVGCCLLAIAFWLRKQQNLHQSSLWIMEWMIQISSDTDSTGVGHSVCEAQVMLVHLGGQEEIGLIFLIWMGLQVTMVNLPWFETKTFAERWWDCSVLVGTSLQQQKHVCCSEQWRLPKTHATAKAASQELQSNWRLRPLLLSFARLHFAQRTFDIHGLSCGIWSRL